LNKGLNEACKVYRCGEADYRIGPVGPQAGGFSTALHAEAASYEKLEVCARMAGP
jgi:hypothetical protein